MFTDDGPRTAIAGGAIDVVVEATGNPSVGIRHARAAIKAGRHIVMVNVEAAVLARVRCSREEARKAGVVYSLAYGDQPALTAEMVDWACAPLAFMWLPREKAPNISPSITMWRRRRSGAITG